RHQRDFPFEASHVAPLPPPLDWRSGTPGQLGQPRTPRASGRRSLVPAGHVRLRDGHSEPRLSSSMPGGRRERVEMGPRPSRRWAAALLGALALLVGALLVLLPPRRRRPTGGLRLSP